jgi:pimeloyl-ACP methyl ester carboxylesterase
MQNPVTFQAGTLKLAALSNQLQAGTKPILCLHGWLDNAASFTPLALQLNDVPLLALEFPGHGHSAHRGKEAHYYFFDWVQDLVALCQQQNWQQLTIIGHSMGGMVATALAAAFPELVARLIVIDSLGFVTDQPQHAARQLREGLISRLKPPTRIPYYASLEQAAAARQRQSDFSLHEAMLLTQRGSKQSEQGWTWRADMRLRHSSVYRLTPEQATALISAVTCPVLALMAQDSAFAAKAKQYVPYYANLHYIEVTGGHHCHMTNAIQVASCIKSFLAT